MKYLFIVIIGIIFCFISTSPLGAKTGPKQGKDDVRAWWGELKTELVYDNNILQTQNNKVSDVIWKSMAFLAYKPNKIKWSGLATHDQFRRNDELSYSFFEFVAERNLGESDYGSLFINHSPAAPLDR